MTTLSHFRMISSDTAENFFSDGDGTVLESSLAVCADWAGTQTQKVNVAKFSNMNHGNAVHDARAVDWFLEFLGFQQE